MNAAEREASSEESVPVGLIAEDLVTDRALRARDKDALTHEPIAARVAELVEYGETPLNIALFGPWGSGKTSFGELLRRELTGKDKEKKDKKVGFVTYNAWQFGGTSLQRNFISHAANQLQFPPEDRKNRRFHRGLYQTARSVDLDFEEFFKRLPGLGVGVLATFLVLLGAVSLGIGAASLLTDENFLGQIKQTLGEILGASAISAVAFGLIKVGLDTATIDLEESAPAAEEEFARTFDALVTEAKRKRSYDRLVFFVDELDRCPKEDVVATLRAIKAFLTHTDCVFVLAADRDVLEEAFSSPATSSVPANTEAPYYSSASEFIDKIFQHQISLPPLRAGKLSGFALDLVEGRSIGIWASLETAPDERLFDRVLTRALIPSHVRSPRRVKVLLNNFATDARIAESRGIDWLGRAEEIAKLTVLRTEYPQLASDLQIEPRLPALLLDPPPRDGQSPSLRRLLDKHRLPAPPKLAGADESETEDAEPEGTAAPDRILSAESDSEIATAQREQLRRYLQRTTLIEGPRADLLYLEVAGQEYGIADPELGHYIEDLSVDDPAMVLEELRRRWNENEDEDS